MIKFEYLKMDNSKLKAKILQVVENQLRNNNPPETRLTFERLISKGYEQEDAKKLIASVLISEIFNFLKNKQEYDYQQYVHALHKLPRLPSDECLPKKDS